MLPEELTKFMGKSGDVMVMEVGKGGIRRYADAVGDHNPLYWDESYARSLGYGSIVAPPGFFGWPAKWTGAMPISSELRDGAIATATQLGYDRILDGGIEYEFLYPIQAGDTLASLERIVDIREREGKMGRMVFLTTEITFTNQNGTLVAKARQSLIFGGKSD